MQRRIGYSSGLSGILDSRRCFLRLNTEQAMARHADPRTAKLLPKLVPQDRLGAFKARLARRMVTLEGSRPVEVAFFLFTVKECIYTPFDNDWFGANA